MINLIIYLDKKHDATQLVNLLLKEEFVANASVDVDNVSFRIENNQVVQSTNNVITAQTKALLFSWIEKLIKEKYGEDTFMYSLPITQANPSFDALIRINTKKI